MIKFALSNIVEGFFMGMGFALLFGMILFVMNIFSNIHKNNMEDKKWTGLRE